jgi:hypothetical protein
MCAVRWLSYPRSEQSDNDRRHLIGQASGNVTVDDTNPSQATHAPRNVCGNIHGGTALYLRFACELTADMLRFCYDRLLRDCRVEGGMSQ